MLKTHVGSCYILEKALFTDSSLCAVSASKSSWHDCNLYGYSWRIRRRILRTDDGCKPNRLQLHEHCWSLKLLWTQSLLFRQQCKVLVLLSSMVVQLMLDPPTFQFPQNV
ncbi:hypothetical protein TNCV_1190341 [Trichonephila clavipes]|nr:hypothetical protein TNCV_1190341 [Trichonephila clavipes]